MVPLSKFPFNKVLKESNYSLFKPKKDECDQCVAFKTGNLEKSIYDQHRKNIERSRLEKENDVQKASEGKFALFCMDVQAVKVVPKVNSGSQYYKTKLQVHNFTIYNIITHDSDNYIWDETEGDLTSSTFTTILICHIEQYLEKNPKQHHIILYSDGCGYQNRNVVLSNGLLNLAERKSITIEQKYLVKGHTQMECDSTHALIEKKIKCQTLDLPSDFVDQVRKARINPKPLNVHHLYHEYFLNYDSKELQRYKSIRPGKLIGDPTVNMLRCLKYSNDGQVWYKINLDEDFQMLPQRRSKIPLCLNKPHRVHTDRLVISKKKWTHLQQLKPSIHRDNHHFYDSIKYE